jgi:predicted helicase
MVKVDKGIIGIITNNSFLNGLIHRKMRGQLLQDFDKIYILNLHGSSRLQEKSPDGTLDQNVFDIMQGVSISILVKENNKNNKNCKLYYKDIWGRKEAKSMILNDNTIHTMDFVELDYEGFNKSFRNTLWGKTRFIDNLNFFEYKTINGRMEKYGNSWGINQIFEEFGSGVSTLRDKICVHFSKNSLVEVINDFRKLSTDDLKRKYDLVNSRDWVLTDAKKDVLTNFREDLIFKFTYRPYDIRYIFYSGKNRGFVGMPQKRIANNFLGKDNIGIVFPRIAKGIYNHGLVINYAGDYSLGGRHTAAETNIAPLYIYQENGNTDENGNGYLFKEAGKKDNFTKEFRKYLKDKYAEKYTPEQILGYIYAILHSKIYREKYIEFLKIDFPRIPFVDNSETFEKLSVIGWELIQHHLLNIKTKRGIAQLSGEGDNYSVEKVDRIDGKVYINKDRYFDGINDEIWNFYIGGYQVLDKWLKERKKHEITLETEDILHFINIVDVIDFTINTMVEIDSLVEDWI